MRDEGSRYTCQVALPGFGADAQRLLRQARILVAGAGGLGCPVAQYLVAAGAGTVGIADFDVVSARNLHRQILFGPDDIGKKKALTACERLRRQNPDVQLMPHDVMLDPTNIMDIIAQYDVVADCTDNFDSRYLINDACVIAGKPVVYAAIYQYEGQVAVWNMPNPDGTRSPNYRDIYPQVNAEMIPNCSEGGVLPTLAGMAGCMQAGEIIKIVTGTGTPLAGKLLLLDTRTLQTQIVGTGKSTKNFITALQPALQVPLLSHNEFNMHSDNYELIDVRTPDEHQLANLGGSNIPLSAIPSFTPASTDKPLLLYCATGKRSQQAARQLLGRFPRLRIYSLENGM